MQVFLQNWTLNTSNQNECGAFTTSRIPRQDRPPSEEESQRTENLEKKQTREDPPPSKTLSHNGYGAT